MERPRWKIFGKKVIPFVSERIFREITVPFDSGFFAEYYIPRPRLRSVRLVPNITQNP